MTSAVSIFLIQLCDVMNNDVKFALKCAERQFVNPIAIEY